MPVITELQAPAVSIEKLNRQRFWLRVRNTTLGFLLLVIVALNIGLLVMLNIQQRVNAKARNDQLMSITNQLNTLKTQASSQRLALSQYNNCMTMHIVDHTPPTDCTLPN